MNSFFSGGETFIRRPGSIVAMVAMLFVSAFAPSFALAATAAYSGSLSAISAAAVTLKPGEQKQITVTFKNTGSATWKRSGSQFVSLYTWDPKYHASAIAGSDWKSSSQTPVISADAAPGKTASITFTIKAPDRAGIYNEHFQLAAEDTAWITGAKFALTVTVSGSSPVAAAPQTGGSFSATKLLLSAQHLVLRGGERAEFTVLYKNAGAERWNARKLVQDPGLRIAAGDTPSFFDPSWSSQTVASSVSELVEPGRTVSVRFALRAPAQKGEYAARFKLTVDDKDVSGSDFQIPVTVTDDAPAAPNPQPGPGISPTPQSALVSLAAEPIIRVGTDTVPISTLVFSSTDKLSVRDASGTELATVPPGVAVNVKIGAAGAFQVIGASVPVNLNGILRFVPANGDSSITGISEGPGETWDSWVEGNHFRGTLEVRYYAPANVTWVINELGVEKYLYGLAEMSDGSPDEYHKALITAARTYAYWHLTHPGKHVTFTVDATYDQVYRGNNREKNQPNTVRAVDATRGRIVHYDGSPVFTPYYANSDGRTRSYKEVWKKDYPWLQSVAAKYDVGKKLFGHGVGISARDAAYRAGEDGWTWDQLLKYYYTGIELRQLW